MKVSKLLFLSALWLMGLSANAVTLTDRVEPTVSDVKTTPVAFEADHQYLLFNTGAKMFFSQGNAWGTRASGNASQETALRLYFTKYAPEGEWDLKSYVFKIYSSVRSSNYSWHECFFDSETAMFVDHASQANLYWEVEEAGTNTYRLKAADVNPDIHGDGLYVGYDPELPQDDANLSEYYDNANAFPLSPKTSENVEWVFYDAQIFVIYDAAQALRVTIEKAEEQGVDVSAAAAVYNNADATLEEIQKADADLKEAMNSGISNGTAEKPSDATTLIENPDFDGASAAGWSGSSPNMVGSGSHGPANVAEFYQGANVDMYQELSGMPAGVYRLTMYGMYRSGNADPAYTNYVNGENYRAKLYATADGGELTTDIVNPFEVQNTVSYAGTTEWGVSAAESSVNGFYIPNDPSCARVYFNNGWYLNTLFFTVGEDGAARIGVKEDGDYISGDWFPFDEFRLSYFGNTAASFQKWVELSAPTFAEDVLCTADYMEAYLQQIASTSAGANDKASAITGVQAIKGGQPLADLKRNIQLWQQWKAKVAEAETAVNLNPTSQSYGDVSDYVSYDAPDIENARALTNEELEAEIAHIDEILADAKEKAMNEIKPDEDVTNKFLVNADFSNGTSGWTYDFTGTDPGNTRVDQGCYEAWHNNGFDIYQQVKDAPVGIYEISVQGFVRYLDGQTAVTTWEAGDRPNIPVYVYLNNSTTQFANVFSNPMEPGFFSQYSGATYLTDGEGYEYPDNMAAAAAVFALDDETKNYTKKAYGLIAKEGDEFRVGVKGNPTNCWPIWDNFKLVYRGFEDASIIQPVLEEALESIDIKRPMGKSIYDEASVVVNKANEAIASGNGAAMFNALSDIYDLKAKIDESVALFETLKAANEHLIEVAGNSNNQNAVTNAMTLYVAIEDGINNHTIEDAEVADYLDQINKMITQLNMPAYADASDVNPVDMTPIVQSASYEVDGANSFTGWNGDGYNFGNDDTQKGALALEYYDKTFNHYQDIVGLPNGVYEVKVDAFGRYGGNDVDYEKTMNEPGTNESYLYAESGDVRYAKAIKTITSDAFVNEDPGVGGNYTAPDGTIYYMPGDMVSAAAFFEMEGKYENAITVKVVDEKLRIGIIKETNTQYGWVIMDNWLLTYFGTESDKVLSGDESQGIDEMTGNVPATKVEFFTLDGRKGNLSQKGIVIMRQTLANGQVVVRKIQK